MKDNMAKNYGAMNKALHNQMGTVKGRKSIFRKVERINKKSKLGNDRVKEAMSELRSGNYKWGGRV